MVAASPLLAASPLAWALDAVQLDGQPLGLYPYQAGLLADLLFPPEFLLFLFHFSFVASLLFLPATDNL